MTTLEELRAQVKAAIEAKKHEADNAEVHSLDEIIALIKWRDMLTDYYGEDAVALIVHDLNDGDARMTPEQEKVAVSFRMLTGEEQWELVKAIVG